MSTLLDDLSPALRREAQALAKRDGVHIKRLVASAVAEKIAAMRAVDRIRRNKLRVSRARFLELLAKAPDCPPVKGDEIPPSIARKLAKRKRGQKP